MLGVIIGVASVIVMVSVASGAGQAIEDRIKALGTNLLVIQPGSYTSGGRRAGEGTALALSESDLAVIRDKIPGVAAATGVVSGSAPIVFGNTNWTTSIDGVGDDFLEVRDWALTEGRNFTEAELRSAAKVDHPRRHHGARAVRRRTRHRPAGARHERALHRDRAARAEGPVRLRHRPGRHGDSAGLDRPAPPVRGGEDGARQPQAHHGRGRLGRRDERRAERDRDPAPLPPPCAPRHPRRLPGAQHGGVHPHPHRDAEHLEPAARRHRRHLADRRRHRHHEHHARVGDRAHQGDRLAHGGRRAAGATSSRNSSSRR